MLILEEAAQDASDRGHGAGNFKTRGITPYPDVFNRKFAQS